MSDTARAVCLSVLTTIAVLALACGSALLGSCYTGAQAQRVVQQAQAVLGQQQHIDQQIQEQIGAAEQAIAQANQQASAFQSDVQTCRVYAGQLRTLAKDRRPESEWPAVPWGEP